VDPYRPHVARIGELGRPVGPRPRTIYLDLTLGREELLARLDRQWRYNMNLARRKGVLVEQTQTEENIRAFFDLCRRAGGTKKFEFRESFELMRRLVVASRDGPVCWRLFVARCSNRIAGGGLVAVCGRTMHQFWSALDRDFRRERPTEALRWGEIEWALAERLQGYDLEGIDPHRNPGTYEFKRRMGGSEMMLPGKFAIPLTAAGSAGAWALRHTFRVWYGA
jgi:lipid II:glycine glycyltransferase (peptidoglycan interpeptide bridge formation enzyme)